MRSAMFAIIKQHITTNTSYQLSSMIVTMATCTHWVDHKVYQSILEWNMRISVWQIKLTLNWAMHQCNDAKHKVNLWNRKQSRCSQSPHFNVNERFNSHSAKSQQLSPEGFLNKCPQTSQTEKFWKTCERQMWIENDKLKLLFLKVVLWIMGCTSFLTGLHTVVWNLFFPHKTGCILAQLQKCRTKQILVHRKTHSYSCQLNISVWLAESNVLILPRLNSGLN